MVQQRESGGMTTVETLIIGSGFGGLGLGHRLRQAGLTSFLILEKGQQVGGTWRDNHYPGCACDVQSHMYSFSFAPNPKWSRMFAPQPEIQEYLVQCAERFGLEPHLRFGQQVVRAEYDEPHGRWIVRTTTGEVYSTRTLVSAMGALSRPAYPKLPGLERFRGKTFHSAEWDHDYDLRGKRVAVIGTGASAIQFVPQIAPQVARLDLYQRSAPWVLPKPDRAISRFEQLLFTYLPFTQRLFRAAIYSKLEMRVFGFKNPQLIKYIEKDAIGHIERHISDPELRKKLIPSFTIGCKRILLSNDYYQALARDNMELITDEIVEVREHGIVTADGSEREVDAIIYGTGFLVQEGLPKGMVFGVGGRDVTDAWASGVKGYKGTSIAGYPNFFMLSGPNTGLGHNSIVYMLESQFNYVLDALQRMHAEGWHSFDVKPEAQDAYTERVQRLSADAVWLSGCKSWYLDERGKNTTLWPGFTFTFRQVVKRFNPQAYHIRLPAPQAEVGGQPETLSGTALERAS